jgi:hypothetical protein
MSLPFLQSFPLDPQLVTGPFRLTGPKSRHGTVTPGTPYGEFATWLYVGVTGNIAATMWDGTTITLTNVPVGWMELCTVQVNTTGTTATGLVWAS